MIRSDDIQALVELYILVYGTRGQRCVEIDEIEVKKFENSKMAKEERKWSEN